MKTKIKPPYIPPAHTTLVEPEGMPKQVASEMLAEPKAKMTNTFRKQCRLVREKWYVSVRERKPIEAKQLARFRSSTWIQLLTWHHRVLVRRVRVQNRYLKLQERLERTDEKLWKEANPLTPQQKRAIEAAMEVLSAIALAQDEFAGNIETEIERRKTITPRSTRPIDPAVRRRAALRQLCVYSTQNPQSV